MLGEPYDPDFSSGFEDWELWIRILSREYRGKVINEPLYYYRVKSDSAITRTHFNRPKLTRLIREKHANLYQHAQLSRIKQDNLQGRHARVWLHKIHYEIGIRFPRIAYSITKIYWILRGV
jgi:hypothetical protein